MTGSIGLINWKSFRFFCACIGMLQFSSVYLKEVKMFRNRTSTGHTGRIKNQLDRKSSTSKIIRI
jgi:hypothetical protein